eukprot:1161668-Pelagomonas_calceolata.AAC.16
MTRVRGCFTARIHFLWLCCRLLVLVLACVQAAGLFSIMDKGSVSTCLWAQRGNASMKLCGACCGHKEETQAGIRVQPAAGTKRKREQEGDQGDEAQAARKARCFLQEFASLPLPDGEGPEEAKAEAVAHASALLKKLEADAQGNPCLAALIAQASAC